MQQETVPEVIPDLVSLKQVQADLNLSRTTVFRRAKDLGIKATPQGNISVVTWEQFQQIRDWVPMPKPKGVEGAIALSSKQVDAIELMKAVGLLFSGQELADPLEPQKRLQELCDNKWLCSSQQLSEILGLKMNTVRSQTVHSRYGFMITAVRTCRPRAWKVEKVDG